MIKEFLFSGGNNISPAEVKAYMADHAPTEYQLLDVRQPKEFAEAHLPGAVLIPVRELSDRLPEVERDKPVFVY